ncbi:MAG: hypothetical protein PHR35_05090 [Kiritimatiellae bacterium]|nr:hypothetical protein [Kiritimatiellia bacterium]
MNNNKKLRPYALMAGVALLASVGDVRAATTVATPAEAALTFNGATYLRDWRTMKTPQIQAALDSRGNVTARIGGSALGFGLEGQAGGEYWKKAEARVAPEPPAAPASIAISGTNRNGVAVQQTVSVSNNTVTCVYRADSPFVLIGRFPEQAEANWFKSRAADGKEVQGELWGESQDLKLYDLVEYTYLESRIRVSFEHGTPLEVTPCANAIEPATFRLASQPAGAAHEARLTVSNVDPNLAPPAGPDIPIVTRPMNRDKLTTGPVKQYVNAAFHPEAFVDADTYLAPAQVLFAPLKGQPAIFKRNEKLAFRLQVAGQVVTNAAVAALELRCVNALDDKTVEILPLERLRKNECDIVLKPVQPGPYRIELWSGAKKVGEDEFVVVGPIEQRKIGPLEKAPFKLREVARIECADDRGQHEFSCCDPKNLTTNEAAGVGRYLMLSNSIANMPIGPYGLPLDWLAYRVNDLSIDKPHLLTVEYPDIDDMVVTVETWHPFVPANAPRDAQGRRVITPALVQGFIKGGSYATSMTSGFIAGNGLPLTRRTQRMSAVFYPGDDWAVIHFSNYAKKLTPMRLSRIIVSEILDDIPAVDAPNLSNDRIFGHYDEWQRDPLKNFASVAVLRGEMGGSGNPRYEKYYKWNYITAERMVKYLRFRGENTWFAGAIRYGGAHYPSRVARCGELVGAKDPFALYARMFEENDLTLVPSVSFLSPWTLKMEDRYTSVDVVNGADTCLQIMGNGSSGSGFGISRIANPLHPKTRAVMEAVAGELAERYRDYPAVKGVMWLGGLGGRWSPSFYTIEPWNYATPGFDLDDYYFTASYDDYTLSQFEKRTGIKVPVNGAPNPRRFAERKAYLLSHCKDQWAAFRCKLIAETWEALALAMKKRCPRMEFYASDYSGQYGTYTYAADKAPLMDVFSKLGTALPEVSKPRSYIYGYFFNEMNGFYQGQMSGLKLRDLPRLQAMNLDASTTPILEEADKLGAYLGRQFFEWHSKECPPEQPWYGSGSASCKYPLAGNRGSMLDYAVILSRCTPLYITHCFVDGIIPQGYDEQFREFGSAFRTIPKASYRTVFRQEYPGITVRSARVGRNTCFYVVNTAPAPGTIDMETTKEMTERTIGHSEPVKVDGRWRIELEPYAIRVFESKGTLSEITVK